MKSTVLPIVTAGILFLIYSSMSQFVAETRLDYAKRSFLDLSRNPSSSEKKTLVDSLESASSVGFSSSESDFIYSRGLRFAGELAPDLTGQIDYFCKSLAALGKAIRKDPFDSKYLIHWADLRHLLGRLDCKDRYTAGDFGSVIEFVNQEDPTNTEAMYVGAVTYLLDNNKERAYGWFNKYLTYGVGIPENRKRLIYESIQSSEDLKRIVPPRFPQLLDVSDYLKKVKPKLFKVMAVDLAALQLQALKSTREEYQKNEIYPSLHRDRVLYLLGVAATSVVRREADGELSAFFRREGRVDAARYFDKRKDYDELDVVRGYRNSDTRPLKTNLLGWGSNNQVYINDFYDSVGFYIPRNEELKRVELVGVGSGLSLSPSSLVVMTSDNNENWEEYKDTVVPHVTNVGDQSFIAFDLAGGGARYWKIHFMNGGREKTFHNMLDSLVRVYGVKYAATE